MKNNNEDKIYLNLWRCGQKASSEENDITVFSFVNTDTNPIQQGIKRIVYHNQKVLLPAIKYWGDPEAR